MAVFVEGHSIIIRRKSVKRRFTGVELFLASVPNATLCFDDNFYRVGFLEHVGCLKYRKSLEGNGLAHLANGAPIDMVAVSQAYGLEFPCDWAELVKFLIDSDPNKIVMACRKPGVDDHDLAAPKGWKYEDSLYSSGLSSRTPRREPSSCLSAAKTYRNIPASRNRTILLPEPHR